nr:hypothetical protein CFP56_67927 [Quercus suber]
MKVSDKRMKKVMNSLGFSFRQVIEAKGFAGGLCMLWRANDLVEVLEYNKNLIAIQTCISDFNCTLSQEEKFGCSRGSSSAVNHLKDLMFEFGAIDLGSSAHLGAIGSDHTPLLLDTCPSDSFAHRPFRFIAAWIRDPNCYSVVENAWSKIVRGSEFTKLCKKHEVTHKALRKWNREVSGHCQSRINDLLHKITEVQGMNPSEHTGSIESSHQSELSEWLARSESLWRQKCRELWLKTGDKNSSFFHLSTIIRRRHNNVNAIKDDDGTWVTG